MTKPVLGYIEHITLPNFGIACYAKVDTGACTSSLHADHIEPFKRDGERWVRFHVQFDNDHHTINQVCEAPVVARRIIASSNGQRSSRYIIRTTRRCRQSLADRDQPEQPGQHEIPHADWP